MINFKIQYFSHTFTEPVVRTIIHSKEIKDSNLFDYLSTLINISITKESICKTSPIIVTIRDTLDQREICQINPKHWLVPLRTILNRVMFSVTYYPEFVISSKPVEFYYHRMELPPILKETQLYIRLIYCTNYEKLWDSRDKMAMSKYMEEEGKYPVIQLHSSALTHIKEWLLEWTEEVNSFGVEFFALCPIHGSFMEDPIRFRLKPEHTFASLWWYIGKRKEHMCCFCSEPIVPYVILYKWNKESDKNTFLLQTKPLY